MLSSNPTMQEVFDHMLNAMRKQNAVSRGGGPVGCVYRGPNGVKCPVGHCIPDNLYKSEMDDPDSISNKLSTSSSVKGLNLNGFLVGELSWMAEPNMIHLLGRAQSVHDGMLAFSSNCWELGMKKVAGELSLNYKPAEN